jgi:hypothetical protein
MYNKNVILIIKSPLSKFPYFLFILPIFHKFHKKIIEFFLLNFFIIII